MKHAWRTYRQRSEWARQWIRLAFNVTARNDTGQGALYAYASAYFHEELLQEVPEDERKLRKGSLADDHQALEYLSICLRAKPDHSMEIRRVFAEAPSGPAFAVVDERLEELKQSLIEADVELNVKLNPNLHDREIRLDNGWVIKIGRGLDFYQKPAGWFEIGSNDMSLRKCLETKVDIFRATGSGN